MNMTSVATNILKLPPKQIQVSPDKLSISTSVSSPLVSDSIRTVSSDSNDPSVNWKSVNVLKLKQNDVTDLCFKADNLQQLSTNALPPFSPQFCRPTKTPFKMYCCSDCGDTFTLKSSLSFHLDRRSVLIQLPCEACKSVQIFYNRCTLQSHIQSHADKNEPSDIEKAVVNPLPCELMDGHQTEVVNTLDDELNCMYEANEMPPSELLEFSMKEDDDTIIIKEKPILQQMLCRSTHLKEQVCEYVFNCMQCGKTVENKEQLLDHIKNSHPKVYKLTSQVEQIEANSSSQPIASYKDEKCLDAHLSKNHVGKLEYCSVCPICKELLPTFHRALNHLRVEHFLVTKDSVNQEEESDVNARKKNVTCHFCRTALDDDAELQEHLKTKHHVDYQKQQNKRQQPASEEKEQPLKKQRIKGNTCSKCDFQSSDREIFKKHVRTHKINKDTFQCQECGVCFVVEPALIKHLAPLEIIVAEVRTKCSVVLTVDLAERLSSRRVGAKDEKSTKLTASQLQCMKKNREKALQLRKARIANIANAKKAITQKEVTTLSQPCDTGAGFFAENDESELSVENRPIVSIPAPLFSSDRPICLECNEEFNDSYLQTHFDFNFGIVVG
ncbi:zinc finger protein 532 [Trichonephila clavipes]|uniref:Zinc finger protein 532 n=1 Tax=Trichonephila clavipes TaxID=2585209 RepID=A0A8X6WEW7_TRICX|nr:zinc finger protein 532 [Trichonephila clavipes]